MATTVYQSCVVEAPVESVWPLIRALDFRFWTKVKSVTRRPDDETKTKNAKLTVGDTALIVYQDSEGETKQTIKITEISELRHSVSWDLIQSDPPVKCMSTSHTIQIHRITETDTVFVEWTTYHSKDASQEVILDSKYKKQEAFGDLQSSCQGAIAPDQLQKLFDEFKSRNVDDNMIDRKEFQQLLEAAVKRGPKLANHVKFVEEFFMAFDKNKDGKISQQEFLTGLTILSAAQSVGSERILFGLLFKLLDKNHDGFIDQKELESFLSYFLSVKKPISLISEFVGKQSKDLEVFKLFVECEQKEVEGAAKKIFEVADLNKDGKISFGEFSKAVKDPKGAEMGIILNVAKFLKFFSEGARSMK